MTGRVLAEIALKTWAIVVLAGLVAGIPSIVITAFGAEDPITKFVSANAIGGFLGGAFVGLSLLIWGRRISQWFFPDTPELRIQFSFDQLKALALAVAGVFLIVDGAGGLLSVAAEVYLRPGQEELQQITYDTRWTREAFVRSLVQVILGVLLVAGRERIILGWSRLRVGL